jgi:hypothetical protein
VSQNSETSTVAPTSTAVTPTSTIESTTSTSIVAAPATPVPLAAGFTLGLDPALGFVPRQVNHYAESKEPMTWPKGIALRGPSHVTIRAWLEPATSPAQPEFTYLPGGVTGTVIETLPVNARSVVGLLINGGEIDIRQVSDELRRASSTLSAADPFGWLTSTLGDQWELVGDSRHGYALWESGTSVLYSNGDDWVEVIVSQPRPAIHDIAQIGLAFGGSAEMVDVSGTPIMYIEGGLGAGGPSARLLDPATGSELTIGGTGGPRRLVDLALGLKPVTITALTAQVKPLT